MYFEKIRTFIRALFFENIISATCNLFILVMPVLTTTKNKNDYRLFGCFVPDP